MASTQDSSALPFSTLVILGHRGTLIVFADHFLLLLWDTLSGAASSKTLRPEGSSRSAARRRQALLLAGLAFGILLLWTAPAVLPSDVRLPEELPILTRQTGNPGSSKEEPLGSEASAASSSSSSLDWLDLHWGDFLLFSAVAANLARELWVRRRALKLFTADRFSHRGTAGQSAGRKRFQALSFLTAGLLLSPVAVLGWVFRSVGSPSGDSAGGGMMGGDNEPAAAASVSATGASLDVLILILGLVVFQFLIPQLLGAWTNGLLNSFRPSVWMPSSRKFGRESWGPRGRFASPGSRPSLLHSYTGSGAKWYLLAIVLLEAVLSRLSDGFLSFGGKAAVAAADTHATGSGGVLPENWSFPFLVSLWLLWAALSRLFPAALSAGRDGLLLGGETGGKEGGGFAVWAGHGGLPGASATSSSSLLLSSSEKYLPTTLDPGKGWLAELYLIWRHVSANQETTRILIFLTINFLFMFVEFAYGIWTNSLGLISDAGHMLFDCVALAIGLYASYVSRKRTNSVYTYGYDRYEVISGFANGVFLLFIGFFVLVEGIEVSLLLPELFSLSPFFFFCFYPLVERFSFAALALSLSHSLILFPGVVCGSQRIFEPPEIMTESLITVSVLGFLVNLVGLVFFHESVIMCSFLLSLWTLLWK